MFTCLFSVLKRYRTREAERLTAGAVSTAPYIFKPPVMVPYFLQQYRQLQQVLAGCRQYKEEKQMLEQCYQHSFESWHRVKSNVWVHLLKTQEEEICFFKTIAPLFLAEVLYYCLRYHAACFVPQLPEKATAFWQREQEGIATFLQHYEGFYYYCQTGATTNDHYYFTRRHNDMEQLAYFTIRSKKAPTDYNYSATRATFIAADRYATYIKSC